MKLKLNKLSNPPIMNIKLKRCSYDILLLLFRNLKIDHQRYCFLPPTILAYFLCLATFQWKTMSLRVRTVSNKDINTVEVRKTCRHDYNVWTIKARRYTHCHFGHVDISLPVHSVQYSSAGGSSPINCAGVTWPSLCC